MRTPTKIILIISGLSTVGGAIQLAVESGSLTVSMKRSIIALVVGFFAILCASWDEISQARKSYQKNSGIMSESISSVEKTLLERYENTEKALLERYENTEKTLLEKYELIAKIFMVYPRLDPLISNLFEELDKLYKASKKYEQDTAHISLLKGYTAFWFTKFVIPKIGICKDSLDQFMLSFEVPEILEIQEEARNAKKSENAALFKAFADLCLHSVKNKGVIKATSIVNPQIFWKDAGDYMKTQESLIDERAVKISRYFVFKHGSSVDNSLRDFNQYKDVIKLNIDSSIETRIIVCRNTEMSSRFYRDIVLVDDFIFAENKINIAGDICKTDALIKSGKFNNEINTIQSLFNQMEKSCIKYEEFNDITKFFDKITQEITSSIITQ